LLFTLHDEHGSAIWEDLAGRLTFVVPRTVLEKWWDMDGSCGNAQILSHDVMTISYVFFACAM
jgi:hypothetical protein